MPSKTLRYDHGDGLLPRIDDVVMWRGETQRHDPIYRVDRVFADGKVRVKNITDAEDALSVHPGNMVLIGVAARDVE